jgi:hypothetical protein
MFLFGFSFGFVMVELVELADNQPPPPFYIELHIDPVAHVLCTLSHGDCEQVNKQRRKRATLTRLEELWPALKFKHKKWFLNYKYYAQQQMAPSLEINPGKEAGNPH